MTNPQQCGKCWKYIRDAKQAILGDEEDCWACEDCVAKYVRGIGKRPRRRAVVVEDD